jgi:hypothetical protein
MTISSLNCLLLIPMCELFCIRAVNALLGTVNVLRRVPDVA